MQQSAHADVLPDLSCRKEARRRHKVDIQVDDVADANDGVVHAAVAQEQRVIAEDSGHHLTVPDGRRSDGAAAESLPNARCAMTYDTPTFKDGNLRHKEAVAVHSEQCALAT
jgi:hypothetical protein